MSDVLVDLARGATPPASPTLRSQVCACIRMGRTIRWDNWLGTPIWWTLLPASVAFDGRTVVLLVLTLASYMAGVASGGTLDDIQGYRDGSDWANYLRSDPTGLRPMTRKPLLLGWITERQAMRYAIATAIATVVLGASAWLLAGRQPWWYLLVHVGLAAASMQYSYGLRLSYRGLQEAVLLAGMIGTIVLPHSLVTGALSADAVVLGLLFGSWIVQVSSYSNRHDAPGDASVQRRTMAVLLSRERHGALIATVLVGGWILAAAAIVAGTFSAWLALALVPTAALHVRAFVLGVRDDRPLEARMLGFLSVRVGAALVSVVNAGVHWT